MKFAPLAAAVLLATTSSAAIASDTTDQADKAEKPAKMTIDTPIEQLMADEKAKAIVAENMGGTDLTEHPMYGQFQTMSLKELQPWSGGQITEEMLEKIAAGLAAL